MLRLSMKKGRGMGGRQEKAAKEEEKEESGQAEKSAEGAGDGVPPGPVAMEATDQSEVELVDKIGSRDIDTLAAGVSPKVFRIGVSSEMRRDRDGRSKLCTGWGVCVKEGPGVARRVGEGRV
jgi:hypothetical protein